jgi:hypothetical protein
MTEQQTVIKRDQIREKSKGSIFLQIGIVIMAIILIWSILGPKKEMETQKNLLALTRAKMKVLFNLQYQYLSVDTSYTTDSKKLTQFALTASESVVPDSMFKPVISLYKRFDAHQSALNDISIKDFKKTYMDSMFYNPLNGQKFIIEITVSAGRKTFNIKPSSNEEENNRIGSVLNGEITWNEKADIL